VSGGIGNQSLESVLCSGPGIDCILVFATMLLNQGDEPGRDECRDRNQNLMREEPPPVQVTKPLLTIAIPTHNRAGCLKELLSAFADQLKDEPRVEFMIADNASADDTPSVVQDFVDRGLRVRYIRNKENIGADANFLQCFEQARGKYVWLFSDDDLIVPGGLTKILEYCAAGEYDLIWVSAYSFGKFHEPRKVKARRDAIEISDSRTYAKHVHVLFTFITGNIINKDTVLKAGPQPFSNLVETNLGQLGWTYTALNHFARGLYIREKLVAMRENNTGGYTLFQVFGPTLATITRDWLSSENLGRIVMNGAVQRFWPLMLLEYRKNASAFADSIPPQSVLTPLFKDNLRYWLFAYPVIILPRSLAAVWVLGVRILNWLDKVTGFPTVAWGVPNDRDRSSEPR
jgi:abequosyltransferase